MTENFSNYKKNELNISNKFFKYLLREPKILSIFHEIFLYFSKIFLIIYLKFSQKFL